MKFIAFAAVAAGAAMVSASPLRVIVVSNVNTAAEPPTAFPNMRFGHAVPLPDAQGNPVVRLIQAPQVQGMHHRPMDTKPRMPCGSGMRGRPGRFRQKAIEIQNTFRKAFGLPLIETNNHGFGAGKEVHGGMVHILPFIGTPPTPQAIPSNHWGMMHPGPPPPPDHFTGYHGQVMRVHHGFGDSFPVRLQNALMSLGPWEGRAVAFVVGAGIGVLLRMIWVFVVVASRGCSNKDSSEYTAVGDEDDEDEEVLGDRRRRTPISAPPLYVYPVDEKAAVKEEEVVVKSDVTVEGN